MVMFDDKKEVEHVISVLKQTQRALTNEDAFELHQLSDQTIHSASITQHTDFITLAIILYSLNKLVTRKERWGLKSWPTFVRKFNEELNKSIESLRDKDEEEFARHLDHARDLLKNFSPNLRPDVEDVIKKAQINKAGKIHEHGISLQQTAQLLDVSQWELLDYMGQRALAEDPLVKTLDVRKRIKQAEDFFK